VHARGAETEPADPSAGTGTAESADGDAAYLAALAAVRAHEYDRALAQLDDAINKKTVHMAAVCPCIRPCTCVCVCVPLSLSLCVCMHESLCTC
jgi:hypothetical protein